ncbi:MAG: YigZ family protein [Bacteroidota bacterium]
MITGYYTIAAPGEGVYKDRSSSFLSYCFPVHNDDEVKTFLQQVKKAHPKCNHHCYAFRMKPDGSHYRSSDDREPSGSAGKPILGQLLSHQLTNTLIVVARYFGGSLLGVPGLINAYRSAAENGIENSKIIFCTVDVEVKLTFPYSLLNEIMQLLKNSAFRIVSEVYGDTVMLQIILPVESYQKFSDQLVVSSSGYQVTSEIISTSAV